MSHRPPARHPLAAALAVLAFVCLAATARAADTFTFTPQVSAKETYDSNVNFSSHGDLEHSLSAGLRMDMQKERVGGWIQAKGSAFKYSRLKDFDRIDQSYSAGLQVNATERVSLDIQGGVIADHAFSNSLAETGQVAQTSARQQYSLKPSVSLFLDEKNSLTLFYAFGKTVYDSRNYTNSQSHTLGATWGYRLSERTQLLLQLTGTRMSTDAARFDNSAIMAGFEYSLAETLKLRMLFGASHLNTRYDVGVHRSSNDYSTDNTLEWKLERFSASAGYNRDMTLGISGDDLVRDRLFLNFGYAFTERFSGMFGGSMVFTEGNASNSNQSNRWFAIGPTLRYNFWEKGYVDLAYAYEASKDVQQDLHRTRNRLSLEVSSTF